MLQTNCEICMQTYDQNSKYPMIICPNQHIVCNKCFQKFFIGQQQTTKCPFCKKVINRAQAIKFRMFFQFKQIYLQKLRKQLIHIVQERQVFQNRILCLENDKKELLKNIGKKNTQINQMKKTIQELKKSKNQPVSQVQEVQKTIQLQPLQPLQPKVQPNYKNLKHHCPKPKKQRFQEASRNRFTRTKTLYQIGSFAPQEMKVCSSQLYYSRCVDEDRKRFYSSGLLQKNKMQSSKSQSLANYDADESLFDKHQ